MPVEERWEHGSFFHCMSPSAAEESVHPWGEDNVLCGSGRDAFKFLINYGRARRGWKRLYVPCYYCQEVVESLISTGIDVRLYPDGPQDAAPLLDNVDLRPGDVVIRVDFFGLRSQSRTHLLPGIETVDDFTHDPWSDGAWQSDADWALVSLRKTLPVSDGGVLWSPRGHLLPPQPAITAEHRLASLERLTAMTLKKEYLEGKPIQKDVFLDLSATSETFISKGAPSGMTQWSRDLLRCFPARYWRRQRKANHEAFAEIVSDQQWLQLLVPSDHNKSCPFSAILLFNSIEIRNHICDCLLSQNIYPSTLWPLDNPVILNIPQAYVNFSRKMLSIHCDARYSCDEMQRVAQTLLKSGKDYQKKCTNQLTQQSNLMSGGV